MAKMSKHHDRVHKAFLGLTRPFDPVEVYEEMCKLLKVAEESIERGIGKLFRDGKLKPPQPKKKRKRAASRTDVDDL